MTLLSVHRLDRVWLDDGMTAPRTVAVSGAAGASDLFQLLRDGRPRTRAELAALTGLARSTVGLRVDALRELGLVEPVGESISSGGRPPSQFALAPSARLVLAADLGASHATVVVSDLTGTILARSQERRPIAEGPEPVLEAVVTSSTQLLKGLDRDLDDVLAIGIGLPGPVEHDTGRAINPPIMPGWDGFDVPEWIDRHLGIPALVDNDVNIMAMGEHRLAFRDVEHLLFVKVATGVGSGIISGGVLQRGAQGSAGDIGHVRLPRGAGVVCTCGNTGCLEAMASGPAIARQLREAGVEVETGQQVVDLVRAGDVDAIRAVRQAGRDIGEVLTVCVSLLNPSVIVLGGSMAQVGEHLLAGVREVVYTGSLPLATEHLSIVQSVAAQDAAVIGASVLAIDSALSPAGIDALLAG